MSEGKIALAGVVVLYYPAETVLENVQSYFSKLDSLILVDNSPSITAWVKTFVANNTGVVYQGDGINRGMAWALNFGAQKAQESGCHWLLTMDQDSRFEAGALDVLIESAQHQGHAGILSPVHVLSGRTRWKSPEDGNVNYVMTSGNLLNLEAYRNAGPFLEKLFIDYVDCEYCLRLRKSGYSVRVIPASRLFHSLGDLKPARFLGLSFNPTHHSQNRKYYITRNRLYVMRTYPGFAVGEAWAWAKEWVKFLLFEEQKFTKLKFMGRGLFDFLRNRYGRCPWVDDG